jgi:hypothetical protein
LDWWVGVFVDDESCGVLLDNDFWKIGWGGILPNLPLERSSTSCEERGGIGFVSRDEGISAAWLKFGPIQRANPEGFRQSSISHI